MFRNPRRDEVVRHGLPPELLRFVRELLRREQVAFRSFVGKEKGQSCESRDGRLIYSGQTVLYSVARFVVVRLA